MCAPKSGSEFAQSTTNDVQKKSTHRRRSEEFVSRGPSTTHVPEIYDHYVDVPHWFSDWVATTLPEIQQNVQFCCKRSSVYDARTFRYREGMRDISLKVWELKIGEIAIPSERR